MESTNSTTYSSPVYKTPVEETVTSQTTTGSGTSRLLSRIVAVQILVPEDSPQFGVRTCPCLWLARHGGSARDIQRRNFLANHLCLVWIVSETVHLHLSQLVMTELYVLVARNIADFCHGMGSKERIHNNYFHVIPRLGNLYRKHKFSLQLAQEYVIHFLK